MVAFLIKQKVDLEVVDKDGSTPLLLAAEEGHADISQMLLENCASREALDKTLIEACQLCEVDRAGDLLRCGANPNYRSSDNGTPLLAAVERGQQEITQNLLTAGATVNEVDDDGRSPLLIAVQKDMIGLASNLLDSGADYKLKAKDGNTPLLVAAKSFNVEMVKMLTSKGSKLVTSEEAKFFEKQLVLAVEKNKEDNVKCLLAAGANTQVKMRDGRSLISAALDNGCLNLVRLLAGQHLSKKDKEIMGKKLCEACKTGNMQQAKLFVSVGANLEVKNSDGCSPLVTAVEKSNQDLVCLLLQKGANKKAKNQYGHGILRIALEHGKLELAELLQKNGAALLAKEHEVVSTMLLRAAEAGKEAEVKTYLACGAGAEAKDVSSETVLHKAAGSGHMSVTKLLLEKKASLQAKGGEYGTTPLFYAARNKQLEVAKFLIQSGANKNNTDTEGYEKYQALLVTKEKEGVRPAAAAAKSRLKKAAK